MNNKLNMSYIRDYIVASLAKNQKVLRRRTRQQVERYDRTQDQLIALKKSANIKYKMICGLLDYGIPWRYGELGIIYFPFT